MSNRDQSKGAEKENDASSSSGSDSVSIDHSQKQIFQGKDLDAAFRILHDNPDIPEPTPEEARRIRNKCLLVMVPFYAMTYHLMYVDKQNIGSASILGLLPGLNIGQNQYNTAVTAFYIAYLVAELPQNYALQRFPIGKWLGVNLLVWTGVLFGHIGITNFGGLFGLRFLLGALEACAVPTVLLSENQFFTFKEQSVIHTGIWAFGNSSPITSGLLSYASLFIDMNGLAAYKVFFVIIGAVTGAFSLLVLFFFPDGPQNAWFLSDREKVQAVLRTKGNRAGIENKVWKKSQFIEAMKDWRTWAFALHALLQEMGNGFTSQYSLIIKSFGFTTLQTTLLGCLSGVVALVSILIAALTLALVPNFRAYISFLMYLPVITGAILGIALPFSNRIGLLVGVFMRSTTGVPYAVVMSWAATTTSGHTKKQTTIAMYHLAYGLSNSISPQLFQARDQPRYIPAWINLLILAGILPAILVLVIRYFLDRENKRRDALEAEGKGFDGGYVETDGQKQHADSHQLDLTDRENLHFRYVL